MQSLGRLCLSAVARGGLLGAIRGRALLRVAPVSRPFVNVSGTAVLSLQNRFNTEAPSASFTEGEAPKTFKTFFVRRLRDVSEPETREYFSRYGNVVGIRLARDELKGNYGFIDIELDSSKTTAQPFIGDHTVGSSTLTVAPPRREQLKKKVYVRVNKTATDEDIRQAAEAIGPVVSSNTLRGDNWEHVAAFIAFEDEATAAKAMQAGLTVDGTNYKAFPAREKTKYQQRFGRTDQDHRRRYDSDRPRSSFGNSKPFKWSS